MAITTPSITSASELRDFITNEVKRCGSDMEPKDFIHAGAYTNSTLITDEFARDSAMHREHALRRGLGSVLRGVPKDCSDCRALEVRTESSRDRHLNGERVTVAARCTANIWTCPKVVTRVAVPIMSPKDYSEDWEVKRPRPLPSIRDYESILNVELELEMEPQSFVRAGSSAPRTKTEIVW